MAVSHLAQKHELECLRLASDCMQLAGNFDSPALQRHFLAMAREWTAEGENNSDVNGELTAISATVRE